MSMVLDRIGHFTLTMPAAVFLASERREILLGNCCHISSLLFLMSAHGGGFHECTCACICGWRPEVDIAFLQLLCAFGFETEPLIELKAPPTGVLLSPRVRIVGAYLSTWLVIWALGMQTQVLTLARQALY